MTGINSTQVVVIGGGPAGMSALLWSAELGQKAILIERGERLGGQLLMIHNAIEYAMLQSLGEGFECLKRSEYGIDLGRVAALWQQAGRAGRAQGQLTRFWRVTTMPIRSTAVFARRRGARAARSKADT